MFWALCFSPEWEPCFFLQYGVTFPIQADVWNGKAHWSYVNCVWIAVCLPSLTNDEWCSSDSFTARRGVFFFLQRRKCDTDWIKLHSIYLFIFLKSMLKWRMTGLGAQCCFVTYITYYRKDHCMNIVSIICGVMIQEYIKFITPIQERNYFFTIIFCKQGEKRGLFYNPVLRVFSSQSCLPQCD